MNSQDIYHYKQEYLSPTDITTLKHNDTLSGEEVVEGFSCQVAELFE